MAEEQKTTFPTISATAWWALREQFHRTTPTTVTASYLATVLGVKEGTARSNVLPALVAFKIIDADGKPLDRARAWRDDAQYAKVCQGIRQEIYPAELLDAIPGPEMNRAAVAAWFARATGVGRKAADKMAMVYQLLSEADAAGGAKASRGQGKKRVRAAAPTGSEATEVAVQSAEAKEETQGIAATGPITPEIAPTVHIDIQIHIPLDATEEYIDRVFASMAKHFYGR